MDADKTTTTVPILSIYFKCGATRSWTEPKVRIRLDGMRRGSLGATQSRTLYQTRSLVPSMSTLRVFVCGRHRPSVGWV